MHADLSCGMPQYQIEIVKYDYVKLLVNLCSNGKTGGVYLDAEIRYGLQSLLYYLCQ